MRREKPLIGITMRHELETERFYLARFYSEAIEAVGGIPVHLALIPRLSYIETVLDQLDGVLLPGSASDVDPLRYGHEPHQRLGDVHPLRDGTDWLVLQEVERRRMPLLAICYGMQMLNVTRGGTLVQDIASEVPAAIKHEQGGPRWRRSHTVRLLGESMMAKLAQGESALVNSHHHQAIASVGQHLRATGWTTDGLVEALEEVRTDRWALGVQWHPELNWEDDAFAHELFATFVEAARNYKGSMQVELEATQSAEEREPAASVR